MTDKLNPDKAGPEDLFKALATLHIKVKTHSHPPLKTVEDSQNLRGNIAGLHSKNLFLKDKKKQLWLVVCEENAKINLKFLKSQIGSAALSFASPDLLYEVLGVMPGSVTPFAVLNDTDNRVRVVLDTRLRSAPILNFHPLINTQTTSLSGAELNLFLKTYRHTPILMDFATDLN